MPLNGKILTNIVAASPSSSLISSTASTSTQTTPLPHYSASLASSSYLSLWFALGRHRHGHFSKRAPFLEPPRHRSPLTFLEPSRASLLLCHVPIVLSRRRLARQRSVKHLACISLSASLQANRPPPHLPSRLRPRAALANPLAQPQLISLSPSLRTLSPRSAARQRAPRPGSSLGRPLNKTPHRALLRPFGASFPSPLLSSPLICSREGAPPYLSPEKRPS
jgi:hypothetical protein